MKVSLVTVVLGASLVATSVYAQTPAAPATPPAQQPAAAPQPPRPFPEGAKVAWVNLQRIASESSEGKVARTKIEALQTKKTTELQDRQKQLKALQDKASQGGTVLSDAARAQLEKEAERIQVDLQRASQDAQAEVEELQRELQLEFQKKLLPLIEKVAAEKGVQLVFSLGDSGLVWADLGLDLSADVIKRLDGAAPAAAPVKK